MIVLIKFFKLNLKILFKNLRLGRKFLILNIFKKFSAYGSTFEATFGRPFLFSKVLG